MGCIRSVKSITIGTKMSQDSNKSLHHTLQINTLIRKCESKLETNYKILQTLGKGAFGYVFKVKHLKTNQIRAMKVIKKADSQIGEESSSFLKEIEIMMKLDHPNIVKIYEYFIDDLNYYLIIEYVSGGKLCEFLVNNTKYSNKRTKHIMKQILLAINYLHSNDIVHRDIKPQNILMEILNENSEFDENDSINIKLIDFGTSIYTHKNEKLTLKVGSPYYMAPEVLKKNYNKKCDIWSAGVILHILFVGYPPFRGQNKEDVFSSIKRAKIELSLNEWINVPKNGIDLMMKMLEKNIDKRLSAAQCLTHPWLNEENNNKCSSTIMTSVLNNILDFNAKEKLQKATIAYIVHFLSTNKEITQLQKVFRCLDKNEDGKLTYAELKQGFAQNFGNSFVDIHLDNLIANLSNKEEGSISYEEFLQAAMDKEELLNEKNLKLAFDNFDINNDGKLSKEEINKVLCVSDLKYIDELLKLIDLNKDGFVSFEEFKNLMKMILSKEVVEITLPQEEKKDITNETNKGDFKELLRNKRNDAFSLNRSGYKDESKVKENDITVSSIVNFRRKAKIEYSTFNSSKKGRGGTVSSLMKFINN